MSTTRPDTDNASAESYETLVQALEEIVNRLESDGLTLDDAVASYEDGMRLVRQCNDLLDRAELRVTELSEDLRRSASDVET